MSLENVKSALMLRNLVDHLVGLGELEDAGLHEGFDGLLDELRCGCFFEGVLDFAF